MRSATRVLVVSTSRGDVRCQRAVVEALAAAGIRVTVVVGDAAGPVWTLPSGDGVDVRRIDAGLAVAAGPAELGRSARLLADGIDRVIGDGVPDLAVVMGDRHELLPIAEALLLWSVPIAHLDGGCVTEGAFDDSVRHALTKLAHLHLCSTTEAAERIRQLGEEEWRIHVVGEPALDHLKADARAVAPDKVGERLGFRLDHPVIILTYHPPTADLSVAEAELDAIVAAVSAVGGTVVATAPGADPGRDAIVERLARAAEEFPGLHVVEDLGDLYPPLLLAADAMIGNSSSGVVETAGFSLPVVDVGARQTGRPRSANVVHAPRPDDVGPALARALDPEFRRILRAGIIPVGPTTAAELVAGVVVGADLDRVAAKRFVDRRT